MKDSALKTRQELGFHSHGAAEGCHRSEALEIGLVPEEAVPQALDSDRQFGSSEHFNLPNATFCVVVIPMLAVRARLSLSRHQSNSAGFWIQVLSESLLQSQVSSPPLLHVSSIVDKIVTLSCFETSETSW